MADFSFRLAMSQFRDEIQNAIQDVGVDTNDLDAFVELFASDFDEMVGGDNGEAIWRRDGRRVRRLGRYLGTIAEFFAVARLADETVARKHLMQALRIMQPECKLGLAAAGLGEREGYCRRVTVAVE